MKKNEPEIEDDLSHNENEPEDSAESDERSYPNDPLHGVALKALLTSLVEQYGWETLANAVPIRCFEENPSISSSLKFLRKTPWAREKVEKMYITGDVRPAWKRRGRSKR